MSLVICSNQPTDGTAERQESSVYDAWNFRNPLSSTMTIPANSQVALQSCKINVDGRVVFSRNNHTFYHYFGDKLNLDGTTAPQFEDSTSYGAITTLLKSNERGRVVELSLDDFAERIQEVIRSTTYHPNCKEEFLCKPLRNASGHDFLGYEFQFKQNASTSNVNNKPGNGTLENFYLDQQDDLPFTYLNDVFKRDTTNIGDTAVGICKKQPFSMTNGSFIVNISNGSFSNANASECEWAIGLSRAVNQVDNNGYFYPDYATYDDGLDLSLEFFADFGLGCNNNGDLVIFHAVNSRGKDPALLTTTEIEYWSNASGHSDFTGGDSRLNLSNDLGDYTKFGFFSNGEDMQVKGWNNTNTEWRDVIKFPGVGNGSATTYFKPVNQSCWCLHPVLSVGINAEGTNLTSTLQLEEFSGLGLTGYAMPTFDNPNSAGWWELQEWLGKTWRCRDVESRTWNDPATNTRDYKELNSAGGVDAQFVMILEESEVYKQTARSNAKHIFGFTNSVVDTPNSGAGTNTIVYESSTIPELTSSMAMFVRLNNFGQNVVNAHQGNQSKIIAHLPRFDNTQQTGRLFFSPNEMVFLDLNNPAPMQINEFDISFCYVNEQYARILAGQSIVALYFREKPKM